MSGTAPRPDHPSLLPALLAADAAEDRVRRSARDWLIDVLCFLLAAGSSARTHPPPRSRRRPA